MVNVDPSKIRSRLNNHLRYGLLLLVIVFPFIGQCSVNAQHQLAELEASSGGRLGVSALNTANNERIDYHARQRFAMCSTMKFMVASAILKQSMSDHHLLKKNITYTKNYIFAAGYAPITQHYIASGMSVTQLCSAAVTHSDSVAANLLLEQLGGPKAITAFARSIGDKTFRLDREEPALNSAIPGDLRDTTSPLAMVTSLQQLVLGNALAMPQRDLLQTWLKASVTGQHRIRAAVPQNWIVGDKTGTGNYGTTNDIGIVWPPHCAPIVIAIYFTQTNKDAMPREDVVAAAAHIITQAFTESCHHPELVSGSQRS